MFPNNIDLNCKNSDIKAIYLLEQITPIQCEQTLYHVIALAVFILLMNSFGSVYGTDSVNNWDMKRQGEWISRVMSKGNAATLYIQNSLARIQYLQRRESILDHGISVAIKMTFICTERRILCSLIPPIGTSISIRLSLSIWRHHVDLYVLAGFLTA
jgi:hypothetical protein